MGSAGADKTRAKGDKQRTFSRGDATNAEKGKGRVGVSFADKINNK